LFDIQADCQACLDDLPEALKNSTIAEHLREVCELDLPAGRGAAAEGLERTEPPEVCGAVGRAGAKAAADCGFQTRLPLLWARIPRRSLGGTCRPRVEEHAADRR
jgi:hypothetical protein